MTESSGPPLWRLYPAGLHDAVNVAAKTHEHAGQYLEQAPAVLAFVCHGGTPHRASDLAYLARSFGSATYRRPQLRHLLAAFGAPLPIRKIGGQACMPSFLPAIYDLRTIPPSVLSQAIPARIGHQRSWLAALSEVRTLRRKEPFRQQWGDDLWRWAVPALGSAATAYASTRGDPARRTLKDVVGDVLDMLGRGGVPLNPVWTFQQAAAAAAAWHHRLARQRTEEGMLKGLGFAFDYRFPYGPIPDETTIPPYSFHALRSGEDLFEEGHAMRHCVASYIGDVARGGMFIVGIRQGEKRIATLELRKDKGARSLRLGQLKGPCNAPVPPAVAVAVDGYLAHIKAAQEEARGSVVKNLLSGIFQQ